MNERIALVVGLLRGDEPEGAYRVDTVAAQAHYGPRGGRQDGA